MPRLRSWTRPAPALRLCMLVALLALAACRREPPPAELPGAASEPAGAVRQLATHLQNNDLQAFARDALPPQEHAALARAWAEGHSRWPVTELPLDEQLGPLLAALSAPGSEQALRRSFERQMAGQDAALRNAARSLALFGVQYVRTQDDYSAEERGHYSQVIGALGAILAIPLTLFVKALLIDSDPRSRWVSIFLSAGDTPVRAPDEIEPSPPQMTIRSAMLRRRTMSRAISGRASNVSIVTSIPASSNCLKGPSRDSCPRR